MASRILPFAISLLVASPVVQADFASDAEQIFKQGQQVYPQFFPNDQPSNTFDHWLYRFYPSTNIFLGFNKNDSGVYIFGETLGIAKAPAYLDSMASIATILDKQIAAKLDSDIELFFNLSQQVYPQFYPTDEKTQTIDAWAYRYYPSIEVYLGVNKEDKKVYILGGLFGLSPRVIDNLDASLATLTLKAPEIEAPLEKKIIISSPLSAAYINSREVQITGEVPKGVVDKVTVNGVIADMNGHMFSSKINLIEGKNTLVVIANYQDGSQLSHAISITSDIKPPALVSAISVSNKEVLVQFSEPMQGGLYGAENADLYQINNINSLADLPTQAAIFWNPNATTVRLKTHSQTHSSYNLTVSGITDLAGNAILAPTLLINPSSTQFVGTGANEIPRVELPIDEVIIIASPRNAAYINSRAVQVTGEVPRGTLDKVTVNGVIADMNGYLFSSKINLIEGENIVVVLAHYQDGSQLSRAISITSDIKPPSLVSAISVSNTEVLVQFSEAVQSGLYGAENADLYQINSLNSRADLPAQAADFWNPNATSVLLKTDSQAGADYKLTVSGITDLAGNPMLAPTTLIDPSSTQFVGTALNEVPVVEPPLEGAISIASPLNAAYINKLEVQVTGEIPEKALDKVTVNGITADMNGYLFSSKINLIEGENTLVVLASYQDGLQLSQAITVTADIKPPALVSAISVSNTEILVQFSETMQGGIYGAENADLYKINTLNDQSDLPTQSAIFWDPNATTVLLTSYSQSHASYKLTVSGIRDLAGNPMLAPTILVDPSSTEFVGTDPSGDSILDTDGDGLSDHKELSGWDVNIKHADGSITTSHQSSDPLQTDTDGDGVPDNEELNGGMNPRGADTDGDTLTDNQEWNTVYSDPTHQDSDGDGVQDGVEFFGFRTSPILLDTDGDQMSDFDEVLAANRNPLIADLPSPSIRIGHINFQLDTRFTFTDEAGNSVSEDQSFESTLTQSEDETFSSSNENSTINTLGFSQEIGAEYSSGGGVEKTFPSYTFSTELGSEQGSEKASTFTAGQESGRSSEESYHDSLTTSTARDIREIVTREVIDASIRVSVSIDNAGDIPFTISNLELTAQTQDSHDRTRIIPVASLVPENDSLNSINIGALGDPSRGPFSFKTTSVFPAQVEELMKNPRGFIVQLANFDITDEQGNNFAFTSKDVLDRTAGISFDLGDGRVENYRVATASTHDPATGKPKGITMEYALSIIGLQRYATIRDGGNGIVETGALATDKQEAAINSSVEGNSVIISAGTDGKITSPPQGDDIIVIADYGTAQQGFNTITDGGNTLADTTAVADDVQLIAVGAVVTANEVIISAGANGVLESIPQGDDTLLVSDSPHRALIRFRDVEVDASTKRFWVLFTSKNQTKVDLDKMIIRAGEQFNFTYVQDQDGDEVWAREEFLHGSSDLRANTDGTCDASVEPEILCDTLSDKQEIQEGWRVQLRGSPQGTRVYSNPNQADSDRDGLLDHEEKSCGLDPRQRDTDLDGLTDWEELNGILIADDGTQSPMQSRDFKTGELVGNKITQYLSQSSGLVDHFMVDGCEIYFPNGFATDPLNPDTDGDLIADGLELVLGINPNLVTDGPSYLDDDGDGIANTIEINGIEVVINGGLVRITSDPNNPDTDSDGLPDLLEHRIGSNPREVDTDNDGLLDSAEYKSGGEVCVTVIATEPCVLFKNLTGTTRYDSFVVECANADICTEPTFNGLGTNLSEKDSDLDGLDDKFEITDREIIVNGVTVTVLSDPLKQNSDEDLWDDQQELSAQSNPQIADTDDDGTNDDREGNFGRSPTQADRRVTIKYESITFFRADCDVADTEEWSWKLGYTHPVTGDIFPDGDVILLNLPWTGFTFTETSLDVSANPVRTDITSMAARDYSFVADIDATFSIKGELTEWFTFTVDPFKEITWDKTYTVLEEFGETKVAYIENVVKCTSRADEEITVNFSYTLD